MKKRICFVTTVPGTLESFVLPLAFFLHASGEFDITFICDHDKDFAASLPDYIHYIPVRMKRGISIGGISAMLKMIQIFRREKFDLVQYSTPNASLYAALAAKIAGIPVRLYCQWGMAYVGFHGIKRKVFKTIEKTVCRLSTWVEPDSFGNLEFSHTEGLYPKKKGSVIWNGSASGVNLKKFDISRKTEWRMLIREKYGIPDDAVTFGFIGRITGEKGINELFTAFEQILAENPDAYLMLVGNLEKAESVEDVRYEWARSEPHVLFCGYTNVVEQYLAAMDVYVLPSYREGFGSAVIEAEAMGVSVIVSDIPGPTDAMRKDVTGLVVKKANVESLYHAMKRLYDDAALRDQFGASGRVFAAESFEQMQLFHYIAEDRKRLLAER